jgi:hypothetical protein
MNPNSRTIYGNIELVGSDREPCIVCGHPTGDCAPQDARHVPVAGAGVFPSLNHEELFVVKEDIFEERQITPFTRSRVLAHPAGKTMPVSEAKKLGLC